MECRLYIISHKQTDFPQIAGNYPLLVGAAGKEDVPGFSYRDNIGENISSKNKNYCELTGLYWIWKNTASDIAGICHYRRFFTKNMFSIRDKGFLTEMDICRILSRYDVIVPRKWYLEKSVIDSVRIAPNKADMKELEQAIQAVAPDYLETYHTFLNGNESYLYNMCIMKKELLDEYCQWLFPILFYVEQIHDLSKEDAYRSRLFGFLSERLLGVWLMKNIEPSRIKEVCVVKTDESALRNILHEMKNQYRRLRWHCRRLRTKR